MHAQSRRQATTCRLDEGIDADTLIIARWCFRRTDDAHSHFYFYRDDHIVMEMTVDLDVRRISSM